MQGRTVRNAMVDPPDVVVVKPDGHFYRATLVSNINDSIVKMEDGEVVLRAHARTKGYRMLAEVADDDTQHKLLVVFFRKDKEARGRLAMPAELLPKKVKDMRTTAAAGAKFDMEAALAEVAGE